MAILDTGFSLPQTRDHENIALAKREEIEACIAYYDHVDRHDCV